MTVSHCPSFSSLALLAVVAMLIVHRAGVPEMFESLGGQLPLPTMMLVYLSQSVVFKKKKNCCPVLAPCSPSHFSIWWPRRIQNTERSCTQGRAGSAQAPSSLCSGPCSRKSPSRPFRPQLLSVRGGRAILRALNIVRPPATG
jgi:hypothetical protein